MLNNKKIKEILESYNENILDLPSKIFLSNIQSFYNTEYKKYNITLYIGFPLNIQQKILVLDQLKLYLKDYLIEVSFTLNLKVQILKHKTLQGLSTKKNIKNIIAVVSAKGGVGKSTISSNIAASIMKMGAKVGILDADIHGPSQPVIMGTKNENHDISELNKIVPMIRHNIKIVSMGNLIKDKTEALIWRGPILSKIVIQLLQESVWGELDYLIIDLPPGTGDIPLTLVNKIPITSAVFVTTPQSLSYINVARSIKMFKKFNIHCTGIIENMSYYKCVNCKNKLNIFGINKNKKEIYDKFKLNCLSLIPINTDICKLADLGIPIMIDNHHTEIQNIYYKLSLKITAKIAQMKKTSIIDNVKVL